MKKYVADFETTTLPEDCRVWAYAIVDIENTENVKIGTNIDEFIENITDSSEDQKIALLGKENYEEKLAEKEAHKLEVQLKKEDKIKYAELKAQQKAEAKEAEKRALLGEELYAKKLAEAQAEK